MRAGPASRGVRPTTVPAPGRAATVAGIWDEAPRRRLRRARRVPGLACRRRGNGRVRRATRGENRTNCECGQGRLDLHHTRNRRDSEPTEPGWSYQSGGRAALDVPIGTVPDRRNHVVRGTRLDAVFTPRPQSEAPDHMRGPRSPSNYANLMVVIEIDSAQLMGRATAAGWVELDFPSNVPLLVLAKILGDAVPSRRSGPVSEIVLSVRSPQARPNSLSRRYGLGPLPLHTDGAHHVVPPRWVVMRLMAGSESPMPTLLARTHGLQQNPDAWKRLARTTCVVRDGRRGFLTCVAANGSRGSFVRWDPGCMTPTSPEDESAIADMTRVVVSGGVTRHCWSEGRAMVIDNWAVLHGRGEVDTPGTTKYRALERILIRARGAT
jgi:hypothetical protein